MAASVSTLALSQSLPALNFSSLSKEQLETEIEQLESENEELRRQIDQARNRRRATAAPDHQLTSLQRAARIRWQRLRVLAAVSPSQIHPLV